jgi:uncharacterized protein HemX
MKIFALLVALVAALLVLFAALNWPALNATAPVSLGVATIDAAPGVILLACALGLALALLAYAAWHRTAQLVEARRHAQELRELRALADNAEASRLRELRTDLEQEFAALRRTVEESGNGLAAAIGQIDDKLNAPLAAQATLPAPRP